MLEAEDCFALANTPTHMLNPHSVAGRTEPNTVRRDYDLSRDYGIPWQCVLEIGRQVVRIRRRDFRLHVTECLDWREPVDGDRQEAVTKTAVSLLERIGCLNLVQM